MIKTTFQGYETLGISDRIELPPLVELMRMPFLHRATLDEAYALGGEYVRKLIDSAPLKHDKKYYIVRSELKFIKPNWCPIATTQWHLDGKDIPVMKSDDRMHILVSDTSNLMTQFFDRSVEIESEEDISEYDFMKIQTYLEDNWKNLGVGVKEVEPNRFITFTSSHPHRVLMPQKPEFRYFMEIRETDHPFKSHPEGPLKKATHVYKGDWSMANLDEGMVCMEHSEQWGVIIRDRY